MCAGSVPQPAARKLPACVVPMDADRTQGAREAEPDAPVHRTQVTSQWRGIVCPRCGSMVAEGNLVVVCPKCYTPNHVECWREHGDRCGACGTEARVAPASNQPGADAAQDASPAPGTPDFAVAAPTSFTPAPPAPSTDTEAAGAAGAAAGRGAAQSPLGGGRSGRTAPVVPPSRQGPLLLHWRTALDGGAGKRIERGVAVHDSTGRALGVVARVHPSPAPAERAAAGAQDVAAPGAAEPRDPAPGPPGEAILEVRTGFLGLGRRLYIPVSAVHDVRADGIFLWRPRQALKERDLAAWRRKPPALKPRERVPVPRQ